VQRRPLAARRRHRGVGGVVFGDVPRVGLPHLCGVCNCHLEKTSVHLLRMLCTHKSDLRSSTNLSRDKPNTTCRAGNDGLSVKKQVKKLTRRHSGNHLSTVVSWKKNRGMMHLSSLLICIIEATQGAQLGL
jgi:hypothetical protein